MLLHLKITAFTGQRMSQLPIVCVSKNHWFIVKWVWINTYRYHFWWDEHPFTSYFGVHQGHKVLTHCHMTLDIQTARYYDLCLMMFESHLKVSPFRQAQTRKYQGERDRFLTG